MKLLGVFFLWLLTTALIGQTSFTIGIDAAKGISDDRIEQIKALKELAKEKQYTSYPDSLAMVYYAIAYRYRILGQDIEVIQAAEKAVELFEEANSDNYQYSFSLSFLGESYQAIGQTDKSIEAYQSIVDRTPKGRDFSIYGYAAFRLAQKYQEVEDYQTALDVAASVLDGPYVDELSDFDKMDLNLAASISLSNLPGDNLDQAGSFLEKAKEIAFSSDDIDEFQRVEITLQSAALEAFQKRFSEAGRIYNNALQVLLAFTDEYDFINAEAASIASNASFVFHEMKAFDKALEFANKSLNLFDKYGEKDYHDIESLLYSNIASVQREKGYNNESLESINKGLSLFSKSPWEESRKKKWILDLLYGKAETLENQKRYDEALEVVYQIDTLFDTHIEDQLSTYSVRQLQKKGAEYYKLGIDIAVRLNDNDAYWYFSEKIKGLRLLRAHIQRRNQTDQYSLKELDEIKRSILLNEYLLDNATNGDADSIRLQLAKLKSQRVTLSQKVKSNNVAGLTVSTLADLNHETPIIQYQSGHDQLYSCYTYNGDTRVFTLGKYESIKAKVEEIRSYLEDPESDLNKLKVVGNELWKILLEPLSIENESIIVLPDEILYFLPFDILMDNDGEYVISNHEVSYAISGTFLSRSADNTKAVRHINFVNPSYDESGGLPTLPYADNEVRLVASSFDTQIIQGQNVRKRTLDSVFANASVFHFSGHAIADIGNDEQSFLALGDGDELEDKLLLGELYSLRSSAQLVVLSACNTGVGSVIEGEGIESLTRGFLYAGAQSVINTLWTVDDQSTSSILGSVYGYLRESTPKPTALRLSKLNYLAKAEAYQRHPYYWAGIVTVGDASPLKSFRINWTKHAILLGLLVLAGWFLTWRYSKKPPPKIEFLGNVFE